FKFSTVRMKLVGSVLLLIAPACLFMYIYDLPKSGFVVGLLALAAAWMGGEFFVRRQARAFMVTAQKIADGNLAARTGLPASDDELGQLSKILDRMAESLQERNAERERTERILLHRALQQTVVAALGQFALTNNDLDAMLNQSVLFVAQTLEVEYASVFKRLPDGELILQTGSGWKRGHVGHTRMPGDRKTQIGFTLNTGEPAIVADSKKDLAFVVPAFLAEHGAVGGVTVAIPTRGQPFGVLGVHTTHQRKF